MRKLSNSLTLVWLLATLVSFGSAQEADFFWSTHDLNQGAVNAPLDQDYEPGTIQSLYLYYTANGPADSDLQIGFFLNIESTQPGAIRFVGAESLEFDITVAGTDIGKRWTDVNNGGGAFGETGAVSDNAIQGLAAFKITSGHGLTRGNDGSGPFLDEGYDAEADAFLLARVDFEVIGNPGQMTEIRMGAGAGMIVDYSCTEVLKPTFNCATLRVEDDALCGLFAFGGCEIQPPPMGDVNGDGITNLVDVPMFIDSLVDGVYNYEADMNRDDRVDLLDVNAFVQAIVGDSGGDPLLGDINCDGKINLLDATCFRELLINSTNSECGTEDLNGDGDFNLLDVQPMVELLIEIN